jgi:cytochrome c oxidase cbb3-type subunit 3
MPTLEPGVGQPPHHVKNPVEDKAWAVKEGKTLFRRYNCSGRHANGGGGMGPALMDNRWIYGGNPEQVFASIVEGRPNGMPSFRGLIPENQVWQLTAYVRSMSGLVGKTIAPGRNDTMQSGAPMENSRHNPAPEQSFVPPSTVQP